MDTLRVKLTKRHGVYVATLQINAGNDWIDLDEDFEGRSNWNKRDAITQLKINVQNYIDYLNRNFLNNDDIDVVDENGGRFEDYEL